MVALWYVNVASGHTEHSTWMMTVKTFNASGDLPTANTAWVNALTALFNGSGPGVTGIGDRIATSVGIDEAVTYTVSAVTGRKTAKWRTAVAIAGQATEKTGPYQASIVVYLTTSARTDGGKCRLWLPPMTNDTVEQGMPAGLTIDHVSNGALTMLRSLRTAGYPAQYLRTGSTELEQITGIMLPNRVSTMESRAIAPLPLAGVPAVSFFAL